MKTVKYCYLLLVLFGSLSIHAQITSYPYLEDFESGSNGWTTMGTNNSWELGTPSFVIDNASSGDNAWVTNLDGFYNNSENSTLVSPEFDFTFISNPIVSFDIWWACQPDDYVVLQYSTNNQASWNTLGSLGTGINWFNSFEGWTGGSFQWVTAVQNLEFLEEINSVYFRIVFQSNNSSASAGVGIDNFNIIELCSNSGLEIISTDAQDETFVYDPFFEDGYQIALDNWIENNGDAILDDFCLEPDTEWTYNYTVSSETGNLIYDFIFTATHITGIVDTTTASFTVQGIGHFSEDVYGTGDTICDDTYDLNTVITDIEVDADLYSGDILFFNFARVPNFEPNEGPFGADFEQSSVDFPDTGAGSYSYLFKVEVEKQIFRYAPETESTMPFVVNDEALITINDKTVAFEASAVSQVTVCGNNFGIQDLTDLLEITPDPNNPETTPQNPFNPNSYWTPSTYTGPGTYVFDPTAAFPNCPSNAVTIVVSEFDSNEIISIPDSTFEQFLINEGFDSNPTPDNQILRSDVCAITGLDIVGENIANFEGLQYFSELLSFRLINNQAASITGLDFNSSIKLNSIEIINCPQVASVNTTQNENLNELTVVTLGSLFNTIDISNNTNLTLVELSNNQLMDLDVSNNPNINYLSVAFNPIPSIDVSNLSLLTSFSAYNSGLEVLNLSNNFLLETVDCNDAQLTVVNLNNGNNTLLNSVELNGNVNLGCIIVDDVSFAESQAGWIKDATAFYITSSDALSVVNYPETLVITYDPNGNSAEIDSWFANNCLAEVSSCTDIQWDYQLSYYDYDFFNFGNTVFVYLTLTATDVLGNQVTFFPSIEIESFPLAGETNEGDGVICGKSFNLNFINGIDFEDDRFGNSTVSIVGDGTINGLNVDFPDTGAGSFNYSYSFTVETDISIGTLNLNITDSASWSLPNVTIPFDPGEDKTLTICEGESLTLMDLYSQFDIVDGTDDINFNPNDFWFDTLGNPIIAYDGPGDYIFNAEAFLPDCGGIPATVTVIEEVQLSAGANGVLEIPVGQTVTEPQLFGALEGSPDPGGVWTPALGGPGIYTYTHPAGVCLMSSAQVEVIEETLSQNSFGMEQLILVPNPSNNFISVKGNDELVKALKIYDISGKQLMQINDNFSHVDIKHLETALYFVHIIGLEGTKVIKLIKN